LYLEVQSMNWYNHYQCTDAAQKYYERLAGGSAPAAKAAQKTEASPLVHEIARAREQIKKSLQSTSGASSSASAELPSDITARISSLELENKELKKVTEELRALVLKLEGRVTSLEKAGSAATQAPAAPAATPAPAKPAAAEEEDDDDDDDCDLFASDDEEDAEAEKLKQERLKAYAEKKAKKPAVIAKSMIIFDVKPWDDETNMKEVEDHVRSVKMDGLLWGTSKLADLAYGIKKLVITCVVEDDKVSTDDLEELITAFDSHVQSVDIAAFNKI